MPSNFRVENDGWEINISDELGIECNDNFSGVVTPPFHGNNAIFIPGWEFRNKTNTADNHGNALRTRYFNFVFNQSDYEAAFNLLYPDPASTNPKTDLKKIPRSRGVFTITELKLGNLIPNKAAWIEFMKFEVKIYL